MHISSEEIFQVYSFFKFLTTTCYFLDSTDIGSNSTLGKHSGKRSKTA